MSRVTWEWLAGFTDGDGCIAIPKNAVQRPSQIKVTWYQADAAWMVLGEITDFLEEQGIEYHLYLHPTDDVWQLRVQGAALTEQVLEMLEPHLILKQEKAQQALEVLRTSPRGRWRTERSEVIV